MLCESLVVALEELCKTLFDSNPTIVICHDTSDYKGS